MDQANNKESEEEKAIYKAMLKQVKASIASLKANQESGSDVKTNSNQSPEND